MTGPSEYQYQAAGFWEVATSKSVMLRAARVALVVGTILAFINHGDRLITMTFEFDTIWRVLLTFSVPYCVSTYSSVLAVSEYQSSQQSIEDDA